VLRCHGDGGRFLLRGGETGNCGENVCDDIAVALRAVEALRRGETTIDAGESALVARLFAPVVQMVYGRPLQIVARGSLRGRPMLDPTELLRGGDIDLDGSISSQFLTGLLMALPLAGRDTTIRVSNLRSIPYIDMTIDVMDRFGIDVDHRDYEEFYVPGGQRYKPADFTIEGDWSAASCLLVAGATSGSVTMKNLHPVSLQADAAIIEALSRAGAHIVETPDAVTVSRRELRAFEFDATDCPDLFPALAALAACCEGTSTIVGTERLVYKESRRAEAIQSEYSRLGVGIDVSEPDVMRISGSARDDANSRARAVRTGGVTVDSHGDHRMAMSLAVAALRSEVPVTIKGAGSVTKSYYNFWNDFEKLRVHE
jgi:3-phosphoshikimate 1-carboxyvinyltransferase